jgi:hypothetical protein
MVGLVVGLQKIRLFLEQSSKKNNALMLLKSAELLENSATVHGIDTAVSPTLYYFQTMLNDLF